MFYDELTEKLGADASLASFLAYNLGFKGLSLQGKFKIDYFSSVKIILSVASQKVYIYGRNLSLQSIDKSELVVLGDLLCLSSREVSLG